MLPASPLVFHPEEAFPFVCSMDKLRISQICKFCLLFTQQFLLQLLSPLPLLGPVRRDRAAPTPPVRSLLSCTSNVFVHTFDRPLNTRTRLSEVKNMSFLGAQYTSRFSSETTQRFPDICIASTLRTPPALARPPAPRLRPHVQVSVSGAPYPQGPRLYPSAQAAITEDHRRWPESHLSSHSSGGWSCSAWSCPWLGDTTLLGQSPGLRTSLNLLP